MCFDLNDTKVDVSDPDIDGDLAEQHFEELNCGGDEIDWSEGYDEKYETWLAKFSSEYYENEITNDSSNLNFTLFNENLYRPENCTGMSQKLLVANHLLQHKCWLEFNASGMETDMPPCVHVKCQGKPGTGKSFVILILRNITRKILKSIVCDVASAPAGVAATLISGMTHYCLFKIPTGKTLTSVPCDRSDASPLLKQKWIASWMKYFY